MYGKSCSFASLSLFEVRVFVLVFHLNFASCLSTESIRSCNHRVNAVSLSDLQNGSYEPGCLGTNG